MGIILFIVVAVIMALIANNKGFNPLLWILAGGLPGIIILLLMPSAKAEGIDEETMLKRKKNGNITGAIISAIAVVLSIILVVVIANM